MCHNSLRCFHRVVSEHPVTVTYRCRFEERVDVPGATSNDDIEVGLNR